MRGWLICVCGLLTACSALPPAPQDSAEAATPEQRQAMAQSAAALEASRPSRVCAPEQGKAFTYRKKVAVLAIPPLHSYEAQDLPGIQIEWSRELQRRLHNSGRFLVTDASDYQLDDRRDLTEQIALLARHLNVQFVIAGQLTSLASQRSAAKLGPLEPIRNPAADSRILQSELDIYDGRTGQRLARRQQGETLRGRHSVNHQRLPIEGKFYRTPLGLAISDMLDRQSEAILDELACRPFAARVLGAGADGIRVDAGTSSNLQPGDQLQLFQSHSVPIAGGGATNWVETSYGTLIIQQVFADAAVGVADGTPQPDWRFGGMVRAW